MIWLRGIWFCVLAQIACQIVVAQSDLSKIGNLKVRAEYMERASSGIVELKGKVKIVLGDQVLLADQATINLKTQTFTAVGKVNDIYNILGFKNKSKCKSGSN